MKGKWKTGDLNKIFLEIDIFFGLLILVTTKQIKGVGKSYSFFIE